MSTATKVLKKALDTRRQMLVGLGMDMDELRNELAKKEAEFSDVEKEVNELKEALR